jgi:hypothetical protein
MTDMLISDRGAIGDAYEVAPIFAFSHKPHRELAKSIVNMTIVFILVLNIDWALSIK